MLPVGIFPNGASEIHNKPRESCNMFEDKRLDVVSVVSHWQSNSYRQLQFATHAFSQNVLQQTVQIGIYVNEILHTKCFKFATNKFASTCLQYYK